MEDYNISWVSSEYEHVEHSADWYWAISIITVSLSIAFVIAGNILLSIIILLGVGLLLYYSKNPPKGVHYKISRSGIRIGEKLYPWETLRSFWIIEKEKDSHDWHHPKLLLISKKTLMPHIIVPLDEYILDEVHDVLINILPEEPWSEPLVEKISRKIGF